MIGRLGDRSAEILQEMISAVLKKDPEALVSAALIEGITHGKINKAKLIEEVGVLLERYASFKNLNELDLGEVLTDLTKTMAEHRVSMPGEYTMLARSLITLEGVIKELCPELNVLEFLTGKMVTRARANFDLRSKLAEAFETIKTTGAKTFRLPSTVFSVLQSLAKGRLKVNFELTGYEDFLRKVNSTVKDLILAAFSCFLFSGACRLCTADIEPKIDGLPVIALAGFVVSIALAIYTVYSMAKKKE